MIYRQLGQETSHADTGETSEKERHSKRYGMKPIWAAEPRTHNVHWILMSRILQYSSAHPQQTPIFHFVAQLLATKCEKYVLCYSEGGGETETLVAKVLTLMDTALIAPNNAKPIEPYMVVKPRRDWRLKLG